MRQQPETIGEAILLYVKQHHGTQAHAAIAWQCSQTMLSEVVRGTRRPTERMLLDLGYRHVEAWLPRSVPMPSEALPLSTDGVPAAPVADQCPDCNPNHFCTRPKCNQPPGVGGPDHG